MLSALQTRSFTTPPSSLRQSNPNNEIAFEFRQTEKLQIGQQTPTSTIINVIIRIVSVLTNQLWAAQQTNKPNNSKSIHSKLPQKKTNPSEKLLVQCNAISKQNRTN